MNEERKPVSVDEVLAELQSGRVLPIPVFGGVMDMMQVRSLLEEFVALRSRIESLERAHGLKPGTSMHAAWKENE